MRYLDTLKKVVVLSVAALSVSIIYTSNTKAANEGVLEEIARNTGGTMSAANGILNLLIRQAADSMGSSAPDTDGYTGQNQGMFAQFGVDYAKLQEDQKRDALQAFADQLNVSVSQFRPPLSFMEAPILGRLKDVNNLAYASIIGDPPANKGAFSPNAYLNFASIASYRRPIPEGSWQGKDDDKSKHSLYFKTVTAIQSFNAYILLQLKAEGQMTEMRNKLIAKVGSSQYISEIASQNMGKVTRQILLFTSQNFILNVQIYRALRELTAATAMQSSLMILINQPNENQLIRNAKGLPLGR